jgi:2-polyprenyl-3-methyl-5-hydroxy-6-metoxy-1,4-benzoquinol methylase
MKAMAREIETIGPIEKETGALFGSLWHRLTDEQYRQSVQLFTKRFVANGFDLEWFRGKKCLDAGCCSGRYAVAMALHGAAHVTECDISESGLDTAQQRTAEFSDIRFEQGSVIDLPLVRSASDPATIELLVIGEGNHRIMATRA